MRKFRYNRKKERLVNIMQLYMPTKLYVGEHCVREHAEALALGAHALIVTSPTAAKRTGALEDITAALAQNRITYSVFDRIGPNPCLSDCFEAAKTPADFVIGIGGGSPMDAAKAVAVLLANPGIDEDGLFALGWNTPKPIVCVGTTAGTGSEVTHISVLTTAAGRKKSLRAEGIYPTVSFADPLYTADLPDSITRATAVDALAHCIESYFSRAATDLSRLYARRGCELLIEQFNKYDGAPSPADRATLTLAALYGGLAISVTGTALPHALSYFLTESHGIPHGAACGVYLPRFLAHNRAAASTLTDAFYTALHTDEATLQTLIRRMMPPVNIAVTAQEIRQLEPRWQGNASLLKTQGDVTPAFTTALLQELYL